VKRTSCACLKLNPILQQIKKHGKVNEKEPKDSRYELNFDDLDVTEKDIFEGL